VSIACSFASRSINAPMNATSSTPSSDAFVVPRPSAHWRSTGRADGIESGYTTMKPWRSAVASSSLTTSIFAPCQLPPWSAMTSGAFPAMRAGTCTRYVRIAATDGDRTCGFARPIGACERCTDDEDRDNNESLHR